MHYVGKIATGILIGLGTIFSPLLNKAYAKDIKLDYKQMQQDGTAEKFGVTNVVGEKGHVKSIAYNGSQLEIEIIKNKEGGMDTSAVQLDVDKKDMKKYLRKLGKLAKHSINLNHENNFLAGDNFYDSNLEYEVKKGTARANVNLQWPRGAEFNKTDVTPYDINGTKGEEKSKVDLDGTKGNMGAQIQVEAGNLKVEAQYAGNKENVTYTSSLSDSTALDDSTNLLYSYTDEESKENETQSGKVGLVAKEIGESIFDVGLYADRVHNKTKSKQEITEQDNFGLDTNNTTEVNASSDFTAFNLFCNIAKWGNWKPSLTYIFTENKINGDKNADHLFGGSLEYLATIGKNRIVNGYAGKIDKDWEAKFQALFRIDSTNVEAVANDILRSQDDLTAKLADQGGDCANINGIGELMPTPKTLALSKQYDVLMNSFNQLVFAYQDISNTWAAQAGVGGKLAGNKYVGLYGGLEGGAIGVKFSNDEMKIIARVKTMLELEIMKFANISGKIGTGFKYLQSGKESEASPIIKTEMKVKW